MKEKKANIVRVVVGSVLALVGAAGMIIPDFLFSTSIAVNGVAQTALSHAISLGLNGGVLLIGAILIASYFLKNQKLSQMQTVSSLDTVSGEDTASDFDIVSESDVQ